MTKLNWLDYAGVIIGIAGTAIAILAFRRTGNIKTLELRIELGKLENTLLLEVKNFSLDLENKKKFYSRTAASKGQYNSGATRQWLSDFEVDLAEANQIELEVSNLDTNYPKYSQSELETRLIAAHNSLQRISGLKNKYRI